MSNDAIPREGGAYQLLFKLDEDAVLLVPPKTTRRKPESKSQRRPKVFELRRGHYCYTGSAARGLASRIGRHLREKKKLFWDVDYLRKLAGPPVRIAWRVNGASEECQLAADAFKMPGAHPMMRSGKPDSRSAGFGNCGCAGRCRSHLAYFAEEPARLPVEMSAPSEPLLRLSGRR